MLYAISPRPRAAGHASTPNSVLPQVMIAKASDSSSSGAGVAALGKRVTAASAATAITDAAGRRAAWQMTGWGATDPAPTPPRDPGAAAAGDRRGAGPAAGARDPPRAGQRPADADRHPEPPRAQSHQ